VANINGGNGDDVLLNQAEDDVINGGLGEDLADYSNAADAIIADLGLGLVGGDASVGTDTLISIEGVIGSDFDDTLFGSNANPVGANGFEIFEGGAGDDIIDGRGGADRASYARAAAGVTVSLLTGLATDDGDGGQDVLFSLEGLDGSAFDDVLEGGAGNDSLNGLAGDDAITGGAGDDVIDGGDDADTLNGGAGNDTIRGGAGDDILLGSIGRDSYDGGAGDDILDLSGETGPVTVDLTAGQLIDGQGNVETLVSIEDVILPNIGASLTGRNGDDVLNGSAGADRINGAAGDDVLNGGGGGDILIGGAGNDILNGGAGTDTADYSGSPQGVVIDFAARTVDDGLGGVDTLGADVEQATGSNLADTFRPGDDNVPEFVDGGLGVDTVDASGLIDVADINLATGQIREDGVLLGTVANFENVIGSDFADTLTGNDGANRLEGGLGDDRLVGGLGDDTLLGGDDDDTLIGGGGRDSYDGGAGADTVDFSGEAGGITFNLAGGFAIDSSGFNETLTDIENLVATAFDDVIVGGAADDIFAGAGGADDISGGAGDDQLDGGAGDDILRGGAGSDQLTGGTGFDTATADDAGQGVIVDFINRTIDDTIGGIDTIAADIEAASGSNFDDMFIVGGGGVFEGGGGVDTVDISDAAPAGGQVNFATGQAFAGNVLIATFTGMEAATGGDGDDTLTGDDNDNSLTGGDGADTLAGGLGDDDLLGGAGDDMIVAGEASGADTVDGGADMDTFRANGDDGAGDAFAVTTTTLGAPLRLTRGGYSAELTGIETVVVAGLEGADTLTVTGNIVAAGLGLLQFNGGGGDDVLNGAAATGAINADGGAGADNFLGGRSADVLLGGAGADRIDGRTGDDLLNGGAGDDTLIGGLGDDQLIGGAGIDVVSYAATINGVRATIDLVNGTAQDGGGTDTLTGIESAIGTRAAGDRFIVNAFSMLNGLDGDDTVDFSQATGPVSVDLSAGMATVGGMTGQLISVERVVGSAFDDVLVGDGGSNRLAGGGGDDILNGGGARDYADYSGAAAGVTVDLALGMAQDDGDGGQDMFISIERVIGSNFVDALLGSFAADTLIGGAGDDVLAGRQGADFLIGGAGSDVYNINDARAQVIEEAGGGANDRVRTTVNFVQADNVETLIGTSASSGLSLAGRNVADLIFGTNVAASGDRINGRGGDDVLIGGRGDDRLTGGVGADRFVHNVGDGSDTIVDFDVAVDLLDLRSHGFADFAAVQAAMTDVGGDLEIALSGTDSLLLLGVAGAAVGMEDVLI